MAEPSIKPASLLCCMEYKALRSVGGLRRPLRALRKEKYIKLREADRRSMILLFSMTVVVANRRLDNAKSHMPYVRTYIPQVRYLFSSFDMLYVCICIPGLTETKEKAQHGTAAAAAPQKQ